MLSIMKNSSSIYNLYTVDTILNYAKLLLAIPDTNERQGRHHHD